MAKEVERYYPHTRIEAEFLHEQQMFRITFVISETSQDKESSTVQKLKFLLSAQQVREMAAVLEPQPPPAGQSDLSH